MVSLQSCCRITDIDCNLEAHKSQQPQATHTVNCMSDRRKFDYSPIQSYLLQLTIKGGWLKIVVLVVGVGVVDVAVVGGVVVVVAAVWFVAGANR